VKNIVILGVVAVILFSLSAGLSLWLNTPKATEEAKEDTKKKAKPKVDETPDDGKSIVRPNPVTNPDEATKLAAQLKEQQESLKLREARLEAKQKQLEVVLIDIRAERDQMEKLRRDLGNELKLLNAKAADLEKKASDIKDQQAALAKGNIELTKGKVEIEKEEAKNILKMANQFDSMAADSAATILKSMTDSGKMETAVKILSQMKDRQAAQVLAAMPDATLAAQLLEKMKTLKRPTTVPPATMN